MTEASVREVIEGLAQAIRDKNPDALMAYYAKEVVVYDVLPPLDVKGAEAYRQNFVHWFSSVRGPIQYEMKELHVTSGESQAFCRCLSHVTAMKQDGVLWDYWVRVTTCLERQDGRWLITHEHISMPARM
jgi:uncharacterized protein (TIGR02246 family)